MTRARVQQISLDATPYYHCVSRCVRRAFLCGRDKASGHSYEHRRQWIEDKIFALAEVFAIEICAYAVMSNHYHVVVHIDKAKADSWSNFEVIQRWHQLYKGNVFSSKVLRGQTLAHAEQTKLNEIIASWRERLFSISQFMQIINESIAREANAEDNCKGRFWEGRYKSQALLDEAALAACMAYVDLNPIRAKMAKLPEKSDHTSIKKRIQRAEKATAPNHSRQQTKGLMPFAGNPRADMPKGLPFRLTDYLELVDWTGRILRADKRGAITANTPEIIERLKISPQHWLYCASQFESRFKGLVGHTQVLKYACNILGLKHASGIRACQQLLC